MDVKKHSLTAVVEDKPAAMPGLDSEWFKLQMRRNHLTTRGLGERVGLHYSAIGRMTNGLQGMKAEDAAMFAKAFGVPVEEVLCRAGVEVVRALGPRRVPVVGWVDGAGLGHVDGLVGPRGWIGWAKAGGRTRGGRWEPPGASGCWWGERWVAVLL